MKQLFSFLLLHVFKQTSIGFLLFFLCQHLIDAKVSEISKAKHILWGKHLDAENLNMLETNLDSTLNIWQC
jgi:hypothetical protein